jgi:hypothetical protein
MMTERKNSEVPEGGHLHRQLINAVCPGVKARWLHSAESSPDSTITLET